MGFFSVLFKVCLFPDSFYRVLNQRVFRAVWHFLLFALLLSLLLAFLHGIAFSKQIADSCKGLMEQTGDFLLSPEKGLQTAKDPEKVKRYLLNPRLSIDFYPGKSLPEDALARVQTPFGLIFMDKGVLFWAEDYGNTGKGRFLMAPMIFSLQKASCNQVYLDQSAAQVRAFLRKELILQPGEKLQIPSGRFTEKTLSRQLTVMCQLLIFLMIFTTVLFSGLLSVLLYSLAQYLWWNSVSQGNLRYSQIFILLLYSAFAPLVTAGLFSLIPEFFLTPQTVFLIAFFIYSLVVFRKVRSCIPEHAEGESPENGSGGDR